MRLFKWFSGSQKTEPQAEGSNPSPASGIVPGTPAYAWLTGGAAGYGRPLSETTALAQGTVYACVGLLSGALASMPLHLYRHTADGRERVRNDLWHILNEQMQTRWTAALGWEFGMQSLLLHGDAFFRIDRVSLYSNRIAGLTPLHPLAVDVRKQDGRLLYLYNDDGQIRVYDQDDVLHVPGLGFDGKRGMSQISYVLRQPVNIANDAGSQAGAFLGDGMRPDLVLQSPAGTKLSNEQIDQVRQQWHARYSGVSNSGAPVVLTGGMDLKQLTMTAVDAQLLETRKLQAHEIAQIFGVPPHMIGMTEKTTSWGSGIEQMSLGFVKYTMQRHLVKFEQEINRKCNALSGLFCEFNTKGIERGDLKSRNESYRIALGRAGEPGWMTVNEVRRAENLPPLEGGDVLFRGTQDEAESDAAVGA
ncbi:phage portal protein [Eikenella exigua]|uniref:Phage portal protein n=1 Tax=Eikenella exigua TaxID=2528037 RepID=A0AAX1F9U7_9NEIS|nr:phage portal protein [Eikenella exigua]QED92861.1 phage portal protein [Eikenella exigua]